MVGADRPFPARTPMLRVPRPRVFCKGEQFGEVIPSILVMPFQVLKVMPFQVLKVMSFRVLWW